MINDQYETKVVHEEAEIKKPAPRKGKKQYTAVSPTGNTHVVPKDKWDHFCEVFKVDDSWTVED